jgi:hypothetical protein
MASSLPNLINSERYKYLLTPAIWELSNKIQNSTCEQQKAGGVGNIVILNTENEALEHIEFLILNLFNTILLASSANLKVSIASPETACSLAMSVLSSQQQHNELEQEKQQQNLDVSLPSSSSFVTSTATTNTQITSNKFRIDPISDLKEADYRVRQVIPIKLCNTACAKAMQMVEKCQQLMNNSMRGKLLKAIRIDMDMQSNNKELQQQFTFPIERIHFILSKEIFACKLDIFVTIYLVYILEFLTKDILRLATAYVRQLEKYFINKSDVRTAIHVDHALTKIFYSNDYILQHFQHQQRQQDEHLDTINNNTDNLNNDIAENYQEEEEDQDFGNSKFEFNDKVDDYEVDNDNDQNTNEQQLNDNFFLINK